MARWNPEKAKELIENLGYTRRFIAKRCGLTNVYSLHQILMGRKPSGQTLNLLASTLKTTPETLMAKSESEVKETA